MIAKAISYVNNKDGNETIEQAKQRLFCLAPDLSQAIMRDAVTISAQAAEIERLRGLLDDTTKNALFMTDVFKSIMRVGYEDIRVYGDLDGINFVVDQIVMRAELEKS